MGGKSGGSPQPSTTTTSTTVQQLAPQQQKLLDLTIPVAEQFVKNPPQLYSGQKILDYSPQELAAQGQITQLANGPIAQQAGQVFDTTNYLLGANRYAESNPYLQSAIGAAIRPVAEQYTGTVLPQIRRGAALTGNVGGTRQGVAEGLAGQEFIRQTGDIASNLAAQNYQTGQQAQLQALTAAPNLSQYLLQPAALTASVGEQNRTLEQARRDQEVSDYLTKQILPFLAAKEVAQLAYGGGGGTSTTTAQGYMPSMYQPSGISQGIGLGATGLGLIGALANLFR